MGTTTACVMSHKIQYWKKWHLECFEHVLECILALLRFYRIFCSLCGFMYARFDIRHHIFLKLVRGHFGAACSAAEVWKHRSGTSLVLEPLTQYMKTISSGATLAFWGVLKKSLGASASFLGEILVRSPRKLFIFTI